MSDISNLSFWKIFGAVSAGCISGALATYTFKNINGSKNPVTKPKKWTKVGTVKKLTLYPIKSCMGIEVSEVIATQIGLKATEYLRDRVFMVVNNRYAFQTQRTLPKMALISVSISGNKMTVSGPKMEPLTFQIPENIRENKRSCRIFEDHVREVLDCGDEIGKWLDTYLGPSGEGFRLVYHAVEKTQRSLVPLQKKFPNFVPFDKGSFQDQSSYMLMAEESVTALNAKLSSPVTQKNFRPSILIHGISEPFSEDFWTFVRIGNENGPILKACKPCTRCKLTTVDPTTGEFNQDGEPLKTLTEMQRSFGEEKINQLVDGQAVIGLQLGLFEEGASIKVGDSVYAAVL